jgi:1A family penicillin-binding protein
MEKAESSVKHKKAVIKDDEFYRKKTKRFIITLIVGFVAFFVFLPFLTYFYFAPKLTSKAAIMNNNDSGVILLDRNNKPFFSFYQAKYKSFVPLSGISPNAQHAVIAVEDRDFYTHPGFSVKSIVRAFFANFSKGEISQGGSTLTQQLVKNSILTPQKSYARKYQEVVIAEEIERKYSKNEILEMYLNSVYFGEGAFGIGQAAEVYFGKDPQNLSLAEASMLAGLLPSPSRYSPISGDVVLAKKRQGVVLKDMYDQKYITQAQYQAASSEQLSYNKTKDTINSTAPHFALMVRDELIKKYGEEQITRSGYQVKTTLNSDWQKYAEQTVADGVDKLARNKVTNGSAVVIDPKTGQILVMVGSKDWYNDSFGKVNMATQARQPGSSFKPIVYTDALQKNIITPGTILHDSPKTYPGGYSPHDYDGKTRGNMTLRRALANSLNLPAVEVMSKVGVPDVLDWSKQLGITTLKDPSQYGYSLVLGAAEVPLVQMTNAYATFANQGVHNDPISILEITDKQNHVVYSAPSTSQQVVTPAVSYIISNILSDNNAKQETFGNALANRFNAAVKTGTTENYVDALTLGYLPNIAVGVWVGNNDHTSMDNIAGALGAAPIWINLMNHFAAELPREYFVKPAGVVTVSICTYTTAKQKDGDKEKDVTTVKTQVENFVAGTEPRNQCGPSPTISPSVSPSPGDSATPTPNQPTQPPSAAPTKGETPTQAVTPTQQPTATPMVTIPVSPSPTPV